MLKMTKLLVASALAALALAAVAGGAVAAEFDATASPAGEFASPSNGTVTFGEGIASIECNLTLSGELDAGPIPLENGAQFGEINEVEISGCDGGSVSGILGLPWPLVIDTILGTAPNALTGFSFLLEGSEFQLSGFLGVTCLYAGEAGGLQAATATGTPGVYTTGVQIARPEVVVPFSRGNVFCPRSGSFRGTFDIEPVQTVTVS